MRCPSNQKQSTACPGESPRCLGRRNATDGMAAATDWRRKACGARAFKAAERAGSAAGVRRAGEDGGEGCRHRKHYIKRSCLRLPGGCWRRHWLEKRKPQPAFQNHHHCHQHHVCLASIRPAGLARWGRGLPVMGNSVFSVSLRRPQGLRFSWRACPIRGGGALSCAGVASTFLPAAACGRVE